MVQVLTDRGMFDISESLYEAIKENNPVLLEKTMANEKHSGDYKFLMNHIKSQDSIEAFDSVMRNAGEAIDSLSDQDKKDFIKQSNKIQKRLIAKKEREFKTDNKNNNNQQSNDNTENKPLYGTNLQTLKDFVTDYGLRDQIRETERISINLVKRIKHNIQQYAGLGGSNTAATKTDFGDGIQQIDAINQKKYRNVNDKNLQGKIKNIKKYDTYSGMDRIAKSEAQLALGGFKLSPYFGYKGYNSKALKYYKSATAKTHNSNIDDMINKMIEIKGGTYKMTDEDKQYYQQFENMVNNFLHNVVYRLEVNNDKKYNNILAILRNDQSLRDMFDISFNNSVQQFDTKENIITYRNKNDKIVDMLIIATPMFYQGKEMFKGLLNIGKHGEKLKA